MIQERLGDFMNCGTVLTGVALALLAGASHAQIVYTHAPQEVLWPPSGTGSIGRVEAGQLTPEGIEDLIALRGSNVYLLHAPGVTPNFQTVAANCVDFAVLPFTSTSAPRVLVSKADGLWSCAWDDEQQKLLPTAIVAGDPWKNATKLTAMPTATAGRVAVAGRSSGGDRVLFGFLQNGALSTQFNVQLSESVLDVAVLEFNPTNADPEVAYATATQVRILDKTAATVSGPHSTLNGFLQLARNPSGGTDADSLVCLLQLYYSGSLGELLVELDRFAWSLPVLCGPAGLRDIHVGRVGVDALEDVVCSSQAMASSWMLHGTAQQSTVAPFVPLAGELCQTPFSGSAYSPALVDPRAVAGDFDHDGLPDIAVVASNRDELFVLPRNPQPGDVLADAAIPVTTVGPETDETYLNFGITVATDWDEEEQPNHAIFEVWLRDPAASPSNVQPGPWISHDELIDGDGPYAITLHAELPAGFNASNVLFYMRTFVRCVDEPTGGSLRRSTATCWLHSFNRDAMTAVMCIEPDVFTDEGMCPPQNGPLVEGFNRRANIRPFADGISPYAYGQFPP